MALQCPPGDCNPPANIQEEDLKNYLCIATIEACADITAAQTYAGAQISRAALLSSTNVGIAFSQASVDVQADELRLAGQAYGAQLTASASITAASTVVTARESASQQVNAAQTAAAQAVSVARVNADYQLAAARIAAQNVTTTADVAATQTVSTARIQALILTASADIAAVQTNAAAQIAGLQVDWQTRLATTQILVTARVAAALAEANAQVNYDSNVAAAEIAASQSEAQARITADGSIAAARISADALTTAAAIAAASTRADAEIQVALIGANAAIAATTTATQAQVTVAGLNPSNQVADIDLEATTYAAHQAFLAKEFGANVAFAAGTGAADLQLQGTVYTATQRLAGVQYASDKDTLTTETVAGIRATATEYVATRQLAGVQFAATAQFNRFELKLGFVEQQFESIWALVSNLIETYPSTVQTPGRASPAPAIGALDVITSADQSSFLASEGSLTTSRAALEASLLESSLENLRYGSTNPLGTLLQGMIGLEGIAIGLETSRDFTIGLAESNAAQLLNAQEALGRQMEENNRVALLAEENLVLQQVGLLGALPGIFGVSGGG